MKLIPRTFLNVIYTASKKLFTKHAAERAPTCPGSDMIRGYSNCKGSV